MVVPGVLVVLGASACMRWSLLERLVEPSTPPPWLLVGLSLLAVVLLLRPSAKLTPLRGVALALGCLLAGL
ncbi:MAG: hypothetical protein K8H88_32225, partial [Sandaracinaceae bacterium]|nr:hypothetical protein [Sandaracinaceae bacterium]